MRLKDAGSVAGRRTRNRGKGIVEMAKSTAWRETHTTDDEIAFINELAQCDMKRINHQRKEFGMKPIDRAGLFANYIAATSERADVCQMDIPAVIEYAGRVAFELVEKAA